MRHFFILLILIFASYCDLKTMEVPDICFISILVFAKELSRYSFLSFVFISAIYLALILLTTLLDKEVPIGMADAKIFASLSFSLGLSEALSIFIYSSIFSGIYAVYLLIKKKALNAAFPFVPFITLGMLSFLIRLQLQNI